MGLKDVFIKKYLGIRVVKNVPGSMILKFSDKVSIADEFRKYDKLLIRGAKLLKGVETLLFDYSKNSIEIKYDPILSDKLVYAWSEIIVDTLIKNMDFIKNNWEKNIENVVNAVEKELIMRKKQLLK